MFAHFLFSIDFWNNKSAGLHDCKHATAALAAMIELMFCFAAPRVRCAGLVPALDSPRSGSPAEGDTRHWLPGTEHERWSVRGIKNWRRRHSAVIPESLRQLRDSAQESARVITALRSLMTRASSGRILKRAAVTEAIAGAAEQDVPAGTTA
jgi:hypothetical protein